MNIDDFYAFRPKETGAHAGLALAFLGVVLLVQSALPVVHVHLVAAGGPLAAASAAGFALAGCLMLRLALQDVGPERRGLFALAGAGASLIALEQVGFGQHLFGTAGAVQVIGVEAGASVVARPPELSAVHRLANHVVVGWTLVSALLLTTRRRLAADILSSGVPFFTWRIMPLTLPPVLLFSILITLAP